MCKAIASYPTADRTGTIDSKELLRALAMGNMHYSISDADHVRQTDGHACRWELIPPYLRII